MNLNDFNRILEIENNLKKHLESRITDLHEGYDYAQEEIEDLIYIIKSMVLEVDFYTKEIEDWASDEK